MQLGDLSDEDATAWHALLAERRLQTLAGVEADAVPDAYSYGVRCDHPETDVTLPEPTLPEDVRDLFDRTLDS